MRTALIMTGLLLTAVAVAAAPTASAAYCVSTNPVGQEVCNVINDTRSDPTGTPYCLFYEQPPADWADECV